MFCVWSKNLSAISANKAIHKIIIHNIFYVVFEDIGMLYLPILLAYATLTDTALSVASEAISGNMYSGKTLVSDFGRKSIIVKHFVRVFNALTLTLGRESCVK